MARGNPGRLIELPSKELAIVYNKQPLRSQKGLIVIYLVDKAYNFIESEKTGKPAMRMMAEDTYRKLMNGSKLIGMVD